MTQCRRNEPIRHPDKRWRLTANPTNDDERRQELAWCWADYPAHRLYIAAQLSRLGARRTARVGYEFYFDGTQHSDPTGQLWPAMGDEPGDPCEVLQPGWEYEGTLLVKSTVAPLY